MTSPDRRAMKVVLTGLCQRNIISDILAGGRHGRILSVPMPRPRGTSLSVQISYLHQISSISRGFGYKAHLHRESPIPNGFGAKPDQLLAPEPTRSERSWCKASRLAAWPLGRTRSVLRHERAVVVLEGRARGDGAALATRVGLGRGQPDSTTSRTKSDASVSAVHMITRPPPDPG